MQPLRNLILAALFCAGSGAAAGNASPYPHWQLVAVEPDGNSQVRFIPARPLDLNDPPRLSVPGAELNSLSFDRETGEIRFMVAGEPGDSLSFDTVLLDYGSGPQELQIGPVQIIWLHRPEQHPLVFSARLHFSPPESRLEVSVTNTGSDTLELTGFHYAPAAVATGQLQFAEGHGAGSGFSGFDLPGVIEVGPAAFGSTNPGPVPLQSFTFTERSLTLEPGGQVLLVLSGAGFLDPGLFDSRLVYEFAPVFEYRHNGETYLVTFTRHHYDREPPDRDAER